MNRTTEEISEVLAPVVERTVQGKWLPGHAKRGGRKSGVKSWKAREQCGDLDPIQTLMEAVLTGYLPLTPGEDPSSRKKLSNEMRLKAVMELAQYTYPKLSATQLTGNEGGPLAVATVDMTEIMRNPALFEAAQTLGIAIGQHNQQSQLTPAANDPTDPGAGSGPWR